MIKYDNIHISYGQTLIHDSSLVLKKGCLTLIHAPSGAGKSALLNRISLIKKDCMVSSDDLDLKDIEKIRREEISYILQGNELVPYLSVLDNLEEAGRIAGMEMDKELAYQSLSAVDLEVPLSQEAGYLSLGERQRLCIACGIVKQPKLLVLDEPTASLDEENKILVLQLLRKLADRGFYVVFASHEEIAKDYSDVIYGIVDKKIVCEKDNEEKKGAFVQKERKHQNIKTMYHHALCYARKNIWQMVICWSFIVFTAAANSIVAGVSQYALDISRKNLYDSTDKYLYVTDGRNQGYLDLDQYPVDLDEGYPIYRAKALLGDGMYAVPYFDEMNLGDKVAQRFGYEKDGLYLSYGAAQQLKDVEKIYSGKTVEFLVEGIGVFPWEINYNGVLKLGIKACYLSNPAEFVYVEHGRLESYGKDIIGRLFFFDTAEEAEQAKQRFENEGYTVNADAIHYDNILEATSIQEKARERSLAIMFILQALLLGTGNMVALRSRRMEMALLRMNGVSGLEASGMLFMENIPALACAILFVSLEGMVFAFFHMANVFASAFLSLVGELFILLALLAIDTIYLRHLNIESVLRA